MLLAAGCVAPSSTSREMIQHVRNTTYRTKIVGWTVDFAPIHAHLFGNGPDVVAFVGGQRGDVAASPALLDRLIRHLRKSPRLVKGRTIVVLPSLNLDGLAEGRPENRNGVDLNRNLPSTNWRAYPATGPQPASEPETRALVQTLTDYRPARVMNVRGPLNHVAFHGPAQYLGHQLARHVDYPVRPPRGFTPSGSLEAYASDQDWPIVTLELERRDAWPTLWDEMREGLEFFITREVTRSAATPAPATVP